MRQGSSGQWGAIPMPAQTQLSPGDALALAQWILSLGQR
jgi:cytochrome c